MEGCIYILAFFFVVIPITLFLILRPMQKHNKCLNSIVNYDVFMRKYVFRVGLNNDEFLAKLKIPNVNDVLSYTLSDDCTVITFKRHNVYCAYIINVDASNESIVLRVEQLSVCSRFSYLINEFFICKFNAEPLDFDKYKF